MPFETLEVVDVPRTRHTRRLVRSKSYFSGDYIYSAMCLLFGLEGTVVTSCQNRPDSISSPPHAILYLQGVCLVLILLGSLLLRRTWRSYNMVSFDLAGSDARSMVASAATSLKWATERSNRDYARFYTSAEFELGSKVITVVYIGKNGVLVNVRNLSRGRGVRWPISAKDRDKLLWQLECAMKGTA